MYGEQGEVGRLKFLGRADGLKFLVGGAGWRFTRGNENCERGDGGEGGEEDRRPPISCRRA